MRADEGVLIKYIWPSGTSLADKTRAKMIRADQGCLSENLGLCWRGTGAMAGYGYWSLHLISLHELLHVLCAARCCMLLSAAVSGCVARRGCMIHNFVGALCLITS